MENEREQQIQKLQKTFAEWIAEHVSADMLQSSETMPEVLKMIAEDRRQQLEEVIELLGPEAEQGLRLSLTSGDRALGDIWLYVWPDKSLGIRPTIHGYEESSGTLYILRGSANEEVYSALKDEVGGRPTPALRVPSFPTQGSAVTVPAHYIHSLSGADGGGTLATLNGFFPALKKVEIFQEEADNGHLSLRRVGALPVDEHTTTIDFSALPPQEHDRQI